MSVSIENNDFIVVSPPILEVLGSFTKLIEKMKMMFMYHKREFNIHEYKSIVCLEIKKKNTKDHKIRYIEHLPKIQYLRKDNT